MSSGRFKKGNIPWNKGKHVRLSPKSEFKVDQYVGKDHPSWTGGVHNMKHDCVHVYTGKLKRARRPHLVVGGVPKGCVVYHLDGDRTNDEPTNLEVITRAELLKRNIKSRV